MARNCSVGMLRVLVSSAIVRFSTKSNASASNNLYESLCTQLVLHKTSVFLSSRLGIVMPFCTSETVGLDETSQLELTQSDADKLYEAITQSSFCQNSMESSIERIGVKLTTPLVIEVLKRLHFEEKLAFKFFTWVGHQENYTHEPQVYTIMIEILSSTKYKVKQFRIACDLLDYMKRNDKTSVPVDVLFNILKRYTEQHMTHLHKFAKKKKIKVKTQPEINANNLLIDSLCKCGLVEDAETMRLNQTLPHIIFCSSGGVGSETHLEA